MDNKKFEKLIDLIINENEEQAHELFHEIVVEKSREIYESIMDEEMMGGDQMVGEVGDLLDEINAEESGVTEEEDDMDFGEEDDAEVVDIDSDDMGEEGGMEEIEDAVVRIEDKLDQLMAEFEQIMGGDEEDMASDEEDMAGDEEDMAGDEEEMPVDEDGMMETIDDMEGSVMEAVQLKQVGGQTYNSYGKMGDNGAQTKSPGLQNSGQAGMDSRPVRFSGQAESVPNSPKEPSNAYAKGKTQVKDATAWKNAPTHKSQDLEKAPAPVKSQASGVNTKSPVSESRRVTKRITK